jgi:hypothetical protein
LIPITVKIDAMINIAKSNVCINEFRSGKECQG